MSGSATPRKHRRRKIPANLPAAAKPLAKLVAAMREPAILTGPRWIRGGANIVFANDAFCDLTGYSPAEAGRQNTRVLHGPKTDLTSLHRGKVAHGEGWLHRKDGSAFYASWSFAAGADARGRAGHQVGVYRDLTETKRLQEALMHSQKLDTVGLLASGVAHDFNNLLSIINGYCEILTSKIDGNAAATKDLQEIHRAGLKAATVSRQILEFSRRTESEERVINFNVLVREIAGIIRRVLGENTALEVRLASDLGNARADPTQFQQTLLNLCFNARDAMSGGGKLTIRTFNHRATGAAERGVAGMKPGGYAAIEVTDTGSGMPESVRRKIFDPFFTTKPHGTGLGLSAARSFAERHGGHIAVRSGEGKGTTFEVYLPETPEPALTFSVALPSLPSARGSESVVLVESDEVLRKMISGILSTDGYRVIEADGAAEAGKLAADTNLRAQLLIADCSSQSIARIVHELRQRNQFLRVLSVSVEPPPAVWRDLPPRDIAHLPKPFALSTLLRSVRTLLDAGAR